MGGVDHIIFLFILAIITINLNNPLENNMQKPLMKSPAPGNKIQRNKINKEGGIAGH